MQFRNASSPYDANIAVLAATSIAQHGRKFTK
jgi:hypothetical protein